MQYEKMLMEWKLNQEQAAAAKSQAEQLEFQKEKMKLELEHQKQISSLKENVSASISINQSINQSFILTRYVKELENSFKIRTCINKIYNNYGYVKILFNFKNNSMNIYI